MNSLNEFVIYDGVEYVQGEDIVIRVFEGRDGKPVAREDTGRIMLIEDPSFVSVKPGDRIKGAILSISGKRDPITNEPRGCSIIRPLEIVEEPEKKQSMIEPAVPELEKPPTKIDSFVQFKPPSIVYVDGKQVTLPRLGVGSGLHIAMSKFDLRGYKFITSLIGNINVNNNTQFVSWSRRFLSRPHALSLSTLTGTYALVSLTDPSNDVDIISPFRAKVNEGSVTIPRCLRHIVEGYAGEAVKITLREIE